MVGPFLTRPADEPRVAWRPGVETRLHASAGRGAAALCVIEQWCAPGAGAPTHTHFEVEEVIAVVEGVAEVWVDGVTERVETGGSVVLPARSWHGFRNAGERELHTFAAFASARPPVSYEDEPETVLEIGVTTERMLDAHRAYRDDEGETQ
jgi:mannose-6-phosphate isomerase-like protein (cupin superfamily)